MTWLEVIQGFESVVKIAAIIMGGTWAYRRFIHARTVQPRVLLSISGEAFPARTGYYLRIKVSAKNSGTPVVWVDRELTTVVVFGEILGHDIAEWVPLSAFGVLAGSELIEPGEEVEEQRLHRLTAEPRVALRLLFDLHTKPRFVGLGKASLLVLKFLFQLGTKPVISFREISLWSTETVIIPKITGAGHGT